MMLLWLTRSLACLRRGTTSATVTSIAFSPPGTCSPPLLCACSDHGSVHVFRLAEMPEPKHPAAALAASAAAGLLSAVTRVSIADMVSEGGMALWPSVLYDGALPGPGPCTAPHGEAARVPLAALTRSMLETVLPKLARSLQAVHTLLRMR